jgi:acyl-coenzyme A synthetase/AMP-(fatty) acid ligase
LAERVAKYELPIVIEKVEQFPTTQNGKIRKLELRKRAEERGITL